MPKKEEEDKDTKEEIDGKFAFQIAQYKVYQDSRQYIVYDSTTAKKTKKGKLIGFCRCMKDAIVVIRDTDMRLSTLNSKTIEKAIDNMVARDAAFAKLLEPLKKLERF